MHSPIFPFAENAEWLLKVVHGNRMPSISTKCKMVLLQAIKDAILGQVVALMDEAGAKACAMWSSTYGINDRIIKEQQ